MPPPPSACSRRSASPQTIDTRNDQRLSRLFANKIIKIYPAFAEFYGMEDAIEQVVSYFRHAAQGLEEKKQILYLLGPVGGGKSSIAERLKQLMQDVPFYAIKGSPVNESPLGSVRCGRGRADPGKRIRHPAALPAIASCRRGRSSGWRSTAATSASSASSSATRAS